MAATTQPISIAPHSRSHSLDHLQSSSIWAAPAASTNEHTLSAFRESSCCSSSGGANGSTVHPAPIFVSGSFGSLAGTSLSFGSKLFPGCSPAGQLLNPLDPSDFKCRMSSSIESDHSSLINSHMPEREIEQCRNFACCGLPLTDLHELVEHFETHHVVVVDPPSAYPHAAVPPRSAESSLAGALGSPMPPIGQPNRDIQNCLSLSMAGGFELDDMELDLDSESPASSSSSQSSPEANGVSLPLGLPRRFNSNGTLSSLSSPPDTPMLATPVSPMITTVGCLASGAVQIQQQHHPPSAFAWGAQTAAEDGFVTPMTVTPNGPAAFDSVHLPPKSPLGMFTHPYASAVRRGPHNLFGTSYALRNSSQLSQAQNSAALVASALNGYAGYSDYSRAFPGTLGPSSNQHLLSTSPSAVMVDRAETVKGQQDGAIPPSLLVGASASSGSPAMPGSSSRSRNPSSIPGSRSGAKSPGNTPSQSRASSPSSSSAASSSSNRKPAPAGPSTTLSRPASSLLLSKPFKCPKMGCMKSYKQANGLKYHIQHGQCNFNPPPELQCVEGLSEREAERRLRPFCCQVPPCQRRYKNMNGLRYHYQHSGDHGAIGLALLASGNHDATRSHSSPSPPAIDLNVDNQNPMGTTEMQNNHRDLGAGVRGRSSAPTTPTVVANGFPGNRFVHTHYVTQSQPASAYASPWGSPRSGSPYQSTGGASGNGSGTQQVTAPIPIPVPVQAQAQVYMPTQWSAQAQCNVAMS